MEGIEITELIAKWNEWASEFDGNEQIARDAITSAEIRWNTTNGNEGVVQKIITKGDLLAVNEGPEVQAFVAFAFPE